jgi:hypothetical protein
MGPPVSATPRRRTDRFVIPDSRRSLGCSRSAFQGGVRTRQGSVGPLRGCALDGSDTPRKMLVKPVRRIPPYRLSLAKALIVKPAQSRAVCLGSTNVAKVSSRPTEGRAGIQSPYLLTGSRIAPVLLWSYRLAAT